MWQIFKSRTFFQLILFYKIKKKHKYITFLITSYARTPHAACFYRVVYWNTKISTTQKVKVLEWLAQHSRQKFRQSLIQIDRIHLVHHKDHPKNQSVNQWNHFCLDRNQHRFHLQRHFGGDHVFRNVFRAEISKSGIVGRTVLFVRWL